MSRLRIADLSFCDTENDDSEKVKGGMSYDFLRTYYPSFADKFYFPTVKSGWELVDQSFAKDGSRTSSYYNRDSGDFTIVESKGNYKAFSITTKKYFDNGESSSSVAFAGY
ncbi:hypothetical protein NIES267_63850 [Calothrix parasitica NIES-267]|uniref:Uncharacterized protein n=1 Tax=Calothrix parasitica NIES-267 TaxID=1973488 RepID=A0A1Z4M056_9CYAN|nr:hypothetical protein NIES267_63850 [Calothrix parasitica NIES-267]